MKILLCLVALFYTASAHYRCRAPRVWESMLSEYIPKYNVAIPLAKLTYDGENRRTRTVEMVKSKNGTDYYDVLYYARWKVAFVFNLKTKKCLRQKIDVPWKPVSIPEGATFLGDAYLGTAGIRGAGVQVQTWVGNSTEQGGYCYSATYTRRACLPISLTMQGPKIGSVVASFYNIVLGISNPNVFIPPKECYHQGQVLMEDFTYINQPVRSVHLRAPEAQTTGNEVMEMDNEVPLRY